MKYLLINSILLMFTLGFCGNVKLVKKCPAQKVKVYKAKKTSYPEDELNILNPIFIFK